jgi:hypothetical protein
MGQGNNIAIFDTWVDGICAQLDLWRTSKNYRGKKFKDAIHTWSGGNNVPSYIKLVLKNVPGMTPDTIMDDEFWRSEKGVQFLKIQATHEAGKKYPAPDEDFFEAQRRVFAKTSITKKIASVMPSVGTVIKTSRGVAAVGVGVGAVAEGTKTANDGASIGEKVTAVRDIATNAGETVATVKEVVAVVPEGLFLKTFHFLQRPGVALTILLLVGGLWLLTYFLRKWQDKQS